MDCWFGFLLDRLGLQTNGLDYWEPWIIQLQEMHAFRRTCKRYKSLCLQVKDVLVQEILAKAIVIVAAGTFGLVLGTLLSHCDHTV